MVRLQIGAYNIPFGVGALHEVGSVWEAAMRDRHRLSILRNPNTAQRQMK